MADSECQVGQLHSASYLVVQGDGSCWGDGESPQYCGWASVGPCVSLLSGGCFLLLEAPSAAVCDPALDSGPRVYTWHIFPLSPAGWIFISFREGEQLSLLIFSYSLVYGLKSVLCDIHFFSREEKASFWNSLKYNQPNKSWESGFSNLGIWLLVLNSVSSPWGSCTWKVLVRGWIFQNINVQHLVCHLFHEAFSYFPSWW